MKSFLAVIDRAPLGPAPWMERAAAACKLHFVHPDPITAHLAKNEAFRKALLSPEVKTFRNPHEAPQLAPFYREALEALTANEPRVLVYGWGWLVFAEKVHACVLDFSGFDAEAEKIKARPPEGMKPKQIDAQFEEAKWVVRNHAKKAGLGPDRLLELRGAADDAEKQVQATTFLSALAK